MTTTSVTCSPRQESYSSCPNGCNLWARRIMPEGGFEPSIRGHHRLCPDAGSFPTSSWASHKATPKARRIREHLLQGFLGNYATECGAMVDAIIGADDCWAEFHVSIPFRTRQGDVVTLYGGHIHATKHVTWDVLDENGDHDDPRFPAGLSCLTTPELIRAIRSL